MLRNNNALVVAQIIAILFHVRFRQHCPYVSCSRVLTHYTYNFAYFYIYTHTGTLPAQIGTLLDDSDTLIKHIYWLNKKKGKLDKVVLLPLFQQRACHPQTHLIGRSDRIIRQ